MFELTYRGVNFLIRRPETVIGRSPYCSIVIPSAEVSREHCRLLLSGDTLEARDLGSRNGTTVNGVRITSQALHAGDVLGLGTELVAVQAVKLAESKTTTPVVDFAPEPTSKFSLQPLELVERMIANAVLTPNPRAVGADLKRAIDSIADKVGRSSDRGAKIRVLASAEIVASWFEHHDLDVWCEALGRRLGVVAP